MVEILSDHGTHYYAPRGASKRRKVKRYLCVGGPLDQQLKSIEELCEMWDWRSNPYTRFNNAGTSSHTMIFVHDDLIHKAEQHETGV